MAVLTKESRIDIRLPADSKRTIEEAANLSNVSLSSYILSVSLKQAKYDLEQNERLVLSNAERDLFLEALDKPALPNEHLKALFK